MYESTEVIVRLSSVEVQQVLAIWVDDDAQEALRFLKEKVVDKAWRSACKNSAGRKMAPCHLTRNNCACCRSSGVVRESLGEGAGWPRR